MAILGSNTLNHSDDLFIQRAGVTRIQLIDGAALFTSGNTGMGNAGGRLTNLEVFGSGGAAFMSFHRPGAYAGYFGIDTDNQFRIGGWSLGNASYPIIHSANIYPYIAGTGFGEVGAYTLARNFSGGTVLSAQFVAGGNLRFAGGLSGGTWKSDGASYAGTWRNMSTVTVGTEYGLFLRVS